MIEKVPKHYLDLVRNRARYHNLTLSDITLNAFEAIPRSYFVLDEYRNQAYEDHPLPIPQNQTISAIHMYVIMLSDEILNLKPGMDVLEIGTGSGYGAALLAYCAKPGKVISIERHKKLVEFAKQNLSFFNLDNLSIYLGDGSVVRKNLPIKKFDRIVVTATSPKVPKALLDQLKESGRLIIPLNYDYGQWLCKVEFSKQNEIKIEKLMQVAFVPLIGEEGY